MVLVGNGKKGGKRDHPIMDFNMLNRDTYTAQYLLTEGPEL